MTVGSLFAGIGGIDLAFSQAGFTVSWAIENSHASCETYRANYPNVPLIEQDIRNVDASSLPSVNVIIAGFPCQSFSLGGKQRGFEDNRGNLFFEVIRFVQEHTPKIIFLENVANLVQHDDGRTFQTIYATLIEHGYFIRYKVMRASEYGNIPQIRDRIYIVAFKDLKECDIFQFPEPIALDITTDSIVDRFRKMRNFYYYNDNSPFAERARQIVIDPKVIYRVYHGSIKPIKSRLCPTLTASMGTQKNQVPLVCDAFGVRKLTLRECLKFQGFPDSFGFPQSVSLENRYAQIGNSVCVPVVRRIAERIYKLNCDN